VSNSLLAGVHVHEAASSPAVRFCGRLFALAGARVHRYSPNEVHPKAADAPALDLFLDDAKTLVREPLLPTRVHAGDVVLGDADADWSALVAGAQVTSGTVDTCAPESSRHGWHMPEIVLSALGGAASYTRTDDGRPVYGNGHRFQYLAGQYLYVALTAMIGVPADGHRPSEHPRVRVHADEVVAALLPYGTTQYAYNGTTTTVEQSGPRFLAECLDGYLCVYAGGPWPALASMLDLEADDDRFDRFAARFSNVDVLGEFVQRWAKGLTLDQAVGRAHASSVAVAPCYDLVRTLEDETLWQNGAFLASRDDGVEITVPGLPYAVREVAS
jgi:crotonobetainyl-CoA:carnitine CoA-transferase CaiB-like acyl-CoA transferase